MSCSCGSGGLSTDHRVAGSIPTSCPYVKVSSGKTLNPNSQWLAGTPRGSLLLSVHEWMRERQKACKALWINALYLPAIYHLYPPKYNGNHINKPLKYQPEKMQLDVFLLLNSPTLCCIFNRHKRKSKIHEYSNETNKCI